MPIAQEFETQEQIPEWLRPSCVERDGKWVFEAELPTETQGLKTALQREREAQKALKRQYDEKLAAIPKDFDAEKWAELTMAEQKRAEQDAQKRGEFEQVHQQRLNKEKQAWNDEKAKLETKITEADKELDRLMIDNEVSRLAPEVGFEAKAIPFLLPQVRAQVKRINGAAIVVDDKGEPVPSKLDYTKNKFISELLAELALDNPFLCRESKGTGATQQGPRGGGTPPKKPVSQWTREEKDTFMAEHGAEAYAAKLMEARGATPIGRPRIVPAAA